jgi:hypothetical protein
MTAVRLDGMVLRFVPTNHPEYGAIARAAVQECRAALRYVSNYRSDYAELRALAGA